MKKLILIVFALFFVSGISSAQFFNKFSLFGGPMIGWQVPQVSDLNAELKKLYFPTEFPKSGFLTLGGGGYIDIPGVNGLRVGGFGTGFTDDETYESINPEADILAAKFSFRYAAISVEYGRRLSKKFEYTLGGNIGIGKTSIGLSRFRTSSSGWGFENGYTLSSGNSTNTFTSTTYTFNPQVGLGLNVTKFMYLKLNAGYMFTIRGDWKLNDVLTVTNVPTSIKADGFNFSLGINFGLFAD
jgi:hypothetical protein